MKNILEIFKDDLKGLITNFLALAIAIGLCVLPSLYAWFNIYSNWDPYANTGGVPIAIVSLDEGFEKEDGEIENMGDTIVENLHDNDKLGWQFPSSEEEAVEGVYSGEYYAALVIPETFSSDMYDCLSKGLEHPKIKYYENEKRNPIAVKITDSGSSSLQSNINTEFVNVVVTSLSEEINEFASDEEGNIIGTLEDRIKSVNDNLLAYEDLLTAFVDCNNALSDSVLSMKDLIPQIQDSVDKSIGGVNSAKGQASSAANKLNNVGQAAISAGVAGENVTDAAAISAMSSALTTANNYYSAAIAAQTTADKANNLRAASAAFSTLASVSSGASPYATAAAKACDTAAQAYQKQYDAGITTPTSNIVAEAALQTINSQMPNINSAVTQAAQAVNNAVGAAASAGLNNVNSAVNNAAAPTSSLDLDEDGLSLLFDGVSETLLASNVALLNSQSMLVSTTNRLSSLLEKIGGVEESEQYQKLLEVLMEDPTLYGNFLSQPVEVNTIPVYETETYGSAVAPFYTVLALWVGVLILTALIKTRAVPKDSYKNATATELYFGRFLIFFVLGQLQSLITVWGDLNILHVQCTDQGLFYLAGAVTSFTFTILIYTLTLSFGDIGKAFAVVIMVIQIAGSSGTYPIELLPDVFNSIYTYFPFPYAINAVRETISGRYENDYYIFLGQLLIFAAASIVVGLVIRKPFMKVNHYIEERMEDTEMM